MVATIGPSLRPGSIAGGDNSHFSAPESVHHKQQAPCLGTTQQRVAGLATAPDETESDPVGVVPNGLALVPVHVVSGDVLFVVVVPLELHGVGWYASATRGDRYRR